MKKGLILVSAALAASVLLSGCGDKVAGVPGTVADVNGAKISSQQYFTQLHNQFGKQALSALVEKEILKQWAEKDKVAPTPAQLKAQEERLKRDAVYDEQVKLIGEQALKDEMFNQQIKANLAKKIYKPTDAELKAIYEQAKPNFVHGARKRLAIIVSPDKAKIEDAAKKLKDGKDFDEVASSIPSANPYAPSGPIKTWLAEDQKGVPANIIDAFKNTKLNEVSKVVEMKGPKPGTPSQYLLMKVLVEQPKAELKFEAVKNELADAVSMQKAQQDPQFEEKLGEKKKDAKIDVKIDTFKSIVQDFKNPKPAANPQMMGGQQMAPGR